MELKFGQLIDLSQLSDSSNRTFMELKLAIITVCGQDLPF